MKILGIDYGRKKIGLAIADGPLAEPYRVIRVKNPEEGVQKVLQVLKELQVEKSVVGVSEGEMGKESRIFAKIIGATTFDETLSTYDAKAMSREAGIGPKRRHQMEDAFAASVMLQNYLDSLS
jgi:putative Holliday junction resolvase